MINCCYFNNKQLFIRFFFIFLLFIHVKSYYIVIDINSKEEYSNYNCGLLDSNNQTINGIPPCSSFNDAGKKSWELDLQNSDFLTYLIIKDNDENGINGENINNDIYIKDGDSIGVLNYFCKINIIIVDRNLNQIHNSNLIINGTNLIEDFMITNEILYYYKCNNISVSINNFKFLNFNSNSIKNINYGILKLNLQNHNSVGFNTTFIFINCLFENSNNLIKTVKFSNSSIDFVHKKIYFFNCIFNNLNDGDQDLIDVNWMDINFYNSTIENSQFHKNSFINIHDSSLLSFYNSSIKNNIIKSNQFIKIKNDVSLIINQLIIQNNTINNNFITISNNKTENNLNNFKIIQLEFNNNSLINESYIINFLDNKNIYDNNNIVINYSTLTNNIIKGEQHGFLNINSNCKIQINNLIIGDEFKYGIYANSPTLITIQNSNIKSETPISSNNTTLILFNNTIENNSFNKSLINSKIIYSNSSTDFFKEISINTEDSNEKNSLGDKNIYITNPINNIKSKNEKNDKLILVIVLSVGIPLTVVSSSIIIYFIRKYDKFNQHKKKENKNVSKESQQTNDIDLNEYEANVDNIEASISQEDFKKKYNENLPEIDN